MGVILDSFWSHFEVQNGAFFVTSFWMISGMILRCFLRRFWSKHGLILEPESGLGENVWMFKNSCFTYVKHRLLRF